MSVRRAQELLKESRALWETEVWGLGRRGVGFGETKCGVWGDEVWGLGRRGVGFGETKCGVWGDTKSPKKSITLYFPSIIRRAISRRLLRL
jgi:hypothetical protein